MLRVDVNCDMGELDSLEADGTQDRLLEYVTSVNVACGAHAGNEGLAERTIRAAMQRGVRVGAHPGYPDPGNLGRLELAMDSAELAIEVERQLRWFDEIANRCGCEVVHIKPHGALYNVAVRSEPVAEAIAAGVARWRKAGCVTLVGLAGSTMVRVFAARGFAVLREGFADRAYEADGSLRSRKLPGALIEDPASAGRQARELALSGKVDTICIHSDTPGSVAIAREVASALR